MKMSVDNNAMRNATWELKEARNTLGALNASICFEDRKEAYRSLIKTVDMFICRAMRSLDLDPRILHHEKVALDSFVPNWPKDEDESITYTCGSVEFDCFEKAKMWGLEHADKDGPLTVYKNTKKRDIVV